MDLLDLFLAWFVGGFLGFSAGCLLLMPAAFVRECFRGAWFRFRWHVLGIKPYILDEAQLKKTIEECATTFLKNLPVQPVGVDATMEEKIKCHVEMQKYSRMVIERYIVNFMAPADEQR